MGPVHQVWAASALLPVCAAHRRNGQGGDNPLPLLSFANQGRNSLSRPSYTVIFVLLLLLSQKSFTQVARGGREQNAPSPFQVPGGDTLMPRSVPSITAVMPAQRNDDKPVLLWVGSRHRPQGSTQGWEGGTCRARSKIQPLGQGGTSSCSIP